MKILRNKILLVLMLFFIFSGTIFASDSDFLSKYSGQVGKGFFNGRSWIHMNESIKTMFLTGLQEGIQFVTMQLEFEDRARLATKLACGLKTGEIGQLMNNFYDDAYNLKMPIIVAYSLIVYKANGASSAEFEERLSGLRKIWQ